MLRQVLAANRYAYLGFAGNSLIICNQ